MNESQPLVSVVIPTYNGAEWVRQAIQSALSQTYVKIEVVVCDDASTDGTVEVALGLDDSRVRVVRNHRRAGLAENWNRGVSHARGDFIKLLMQDDLLGTTCVERLLVPMQARGDCVLSFCHRALSFRSDDKVAATWVDRFGVLAPGIFDEERAFGGAELVRLAQANGLGRNIIGEPTAVLLRAESLRAAGTFDSRMAQLTDWEMWLRLAAQGSVACIPERLVTIRVHAASATRQNARTGLAQLDRLWLLRSLGSRPHTKELVTVRAKIAACASTARHFRWSTLATARGREAIRRYLRNSSAD